MELSKLAPKRGAKKSKVRVGRGESSGLGKTCGRGGKGQTARTGGKVARHFEGGQTPLYRRIPKIGFLSWKKITGVNRFYAINLSILDKFENGAVVDDAALLARGYGRSSRKQGGFKVLGTGKLSKKLTVKVSAISEQARKAIEAAGGSVAVEK